MNIDDLVEEFRNHPTTKTGIAAVVRALRDDIGDGNSFIQGLFNEILGTSETEKAAGGPTREDGLEYTATAEPAADPSVCVWTRFYTEKNRFVSKCSGIPRVYDELRSTCRQCGGLVHFVEAQP